MFKGQTATLLSLFAGARAAVARGRSGNALITSYANMSPQILADIGLDRIDVADAALSPRHVPTALAQSLARRTIPRRSAAS